MAVYTAVSDQDLAVFLADYDIGRAVSFKGIAEGVENSNYFLLTDQGPYILTLYEKRVAPEDLPYFLGLMEHLARRGLACPTPIHGRDGEVLRQLCGRPAAITSFLSGVWPLRPAPSHCGPLGEALAKMHVAGLDYPARRENALSVAGWRALFAQLEARADEVAPGLAQELAGELEELAARWPRDLPEGVIHADLFPDNVFFDENNLSGLIDFYFACNDFLAYDLAVCLNAWCFEPDASFNVTKARLMINAYRKVRSCSAAELDALPLLARGAALRFLLTRLYDWLNQVDGAMVKPKDPMEYIKKLRFHRGLEGPGAYGIS
jgi:homoserine kinase type II